MPESSDSKPTIPKSIEDITEQDLAAFADSYSLFNETISRLQTSYQTLEERFDALNRELEATNLKLQESLADKERISGSLQNILESVASGVVVVDTNGGITLFNQAASRILGWSVDDALGGPCSDVMGDDAEALLQTVVSGDAVVGREKILLSSGGRRVPVRYSTGCIRNPNGAIIGAVETFEDISQLKDLARQASRVNTLTALGEMAATVTHEIRNPLGGIGGFAGLLERDLDVDDPRRRLVKKIIEGVSSLNRMVTNLLNYTRPLELNRRPVDLLEVIEDSLGFFEIDAGNVLDQIDLQRNYPAESIACTIDPEQVQQIVLNLLHNAVQAMPAGGALKVSASHIDASLEDRTELTSECVVVSVADTGIGMVEEIRSKLFMPFFTTKEEGNGLGLANAKKVVEAHGGDVFVDSEPELGSCFTIYLPKSYQ